MGKTIRAFIAIELPSDVIALAGDLQSAMKRDGLALRWVRPQNIHLTLKFLGDIPAEMVPDISTAMQQAGGALQPIALTVQGMGVFPGARNPKVLWIGMDGASQRLLQAVADLEAGLAEIGFEKEKRPFKAHLTLARIKAPVEVRQLLEAIERYGGYAPKSFQASEIVLFQSELKPQGPIYRSLARATLGYQ
ncbi:MAG: RNA 2',3'-cyclic phosphodiesterase [Desulfobacteraceae bacterium]|nr:RNA 2',3'-cyclic phosphodiesterase [Desulfobacteraceae bacterium]